MTLPFRLLYIKVYKDTLKEVGEVRKPRQQGYTLREDRKIIEFKINLHLTPPLLRTYDPPLLKYFDFFSKFLIDFFLCVISCAAPAYYDS